MCIEGNIIDFDVAMFIDGILIVESPARVLGEMKRALT